MGWGTDRISDPLPHPAPSPSRVREQDRRNVAVAFVTVIGRCRSWIYQPARELIFLTEDRMQHVLIIEDQPLIASTLADIVRFAGATSVEIADNARHAVDAAARRLPDVIISDVDLGAGGHGPTAVATIQDRFGPVPAIFVTGHADDAQARACASAILTKPVSAQRLANVIATIVPTPAAVPRQPLPAATVSPSRRMATPGQRHPRTRRIAQGHAARR